MNKRNIAIIAHVDHGKTTLVDYLMKQSNLRNTEIYDERTINFDDIIVVRKISALEKPTATNYKNYKIKILNIPEHISLKKM